MPLAPVGAVMAADAAAGLLRGRAGSGFASVASGAVLNELVFTVGADETFAGAEVLTLAEPALGFFIGPHNCCISSASCAAACALNSGADVGVEFSSGPSVPSGAVLPVRLTQRYANAQIRPGSRLDQHQTR